MKATLLLLSFVAGLTVARAQQEVPRVEALRVAFLISADLKQMLDTPIPTDPDVKRPVALRDGEHGALVFPEARLTAESVRKAGKAVSPIGQLWLRKLVPQSNGKGASSDQLRLVTVAAGDRSETAVLCALGVRRVSARELELLVYGSGKEPLLKVPLKEVSASPQENPIQLAAVVQAENVVLTLKVAGKYEAGVTLVPEQ